MTSLAPFFASFPVALLVTALLLGLIVGSFINVVIHRLPVMLDRTWRRQCDELGGKSPPAEETYNLIVPRSQCPACGRRITALENIPLLSFAILRGKCRGCGKRISWRYPGVELVTGLLSGVIALHFGFTVAAAAALLFTWSLIALTVIDYDHQLLPDNITLPLMWLGLLFNLGAVYVPITSAVIGAMAGYLSLWTVYQLFKLVTGREGMGFGDFKLFAALGAWLGWQQLPLIILLSSFVGAVVGLGGILLLGRDRGVPIPFGPFLCVAGWIALLWGDAITRSYLQFVRVSF
ncbi:MAG TPA: A24 family peptidase [Burkholderiales bacterium]|jgi:leader peptidase (prepilin peptidase)/N-methyltransferase